MFSRKPKSAPMANAYDTMSKAKSVLDNKDAEAELAKVEAEWRERLAAIRDTLVLPAAHRIVRRRLPTKHLEFRMFTDQPVEAWFVEYPYIQDNEPRSEYSLYGMDLSADFYIERYKTTEPKAYVLWARATELPFSTRKAAEQWLRNRINEGSEDVYYDDKGQVVPAPEKGQ